MKIFEDTAELTTKLSSGLTMSDTSVTVTDQNVITSELIDDLVYTAVFSTNQETKTFARKIIRQLATALGIFSASIHDLYMAIGKGEKVAFTVPAMNIRAMTYDTAHEVFSLALEKKMGPFIFEIARSEIEYTDQRPDEYAVVVLAAAIKSGWRGPVFIQGDHFQFSKRKFTENRDGEIQVIQNLIKEAIDADFQNIDIDASTLVDLSKQSLSEQQKDNYEVTAQMTSYIRSLQKSSKAISIGGEIGHIGGVNSTVADFEAFMDGYRKLIGDAPGISKVSVQTGTSHGGIPLADGTIAKVNIDMQVLNDISVSARTQYGIGGSVQHGASTLPNDLFDQFPKMNTLEIHLATGFQNIVYDTMPAELKEEMKSWVMANLQKEKEEGWNDEQFFYKCRKKAIGPFKKQLWMLSDEQKQPIRSALRTQFALLFDKLNVSNTIDLVNKYITH